MKVLLVIHGYPPRYNAGSEVYTQTLAHGLRDQGIDVSVFAREEDPFSPDYRLRNESDPMWEDIPVFLVNHARSNARFRNEEIDRIFGELLEEIKPDVVHFGHLNHLSTGLIDVAKDHGVRIVFTLHDFWLMCPRGQFLQWGLTGNEPWRLCKGQEDRKCAEHCFNRFVTGLDEDHGVEYWTGWVRDRMGHIRKMCSLVDLFLAPSRNLMDRHVNEFGMDESKIRYLDYGFDVQRLAGRNRVPENEFVFGYIGRHHPSKGIDRLITAFSGLNGNTLLGIWGRPEGQLSSYLMRLERELDIPKDTIEWLPEYRNENIVSEVFNKCDCIVVPSIWDENSPLVIHEAQQTGVPVITADHGGMGEYVKNGVNGITFKHRDVEDLRSKMQYAVDNRSKMRDLGERRYLYSEDGSILSIESNIDQLESLYRTLLDEAREEFRNPEGW